MKNFLASKTGRFTLIGLVVILVALTGLAIWLPELVQPFLITVLVVAVLWLGVEQGLKAWRRHKERSFDEKIAAREGIDDRRREWSSWVAELKKQGIHRYDLPFYLLLGEPQSGKSVLLQNSDLHFPFGQSRLSGIGGTRGCDWWFTEEAVILDLAGRLFTHEGGAADAAEWEAFLALLTEFRPLCPANGILLVLPCDSLLSDGAEETKRKLGQMQEALVALTGRLQASLPVYLVLTKADKVFGFADSVHRLDAVRRHEMFGWSRDAERFDRPFEEAEARAGFEGIVERARDLRGYMLSTARIPEAIPEVDRMFAFPDELSALYGAVGTYLRGIFEESALVDRLYFRGMYLTSGLQTGAPIAKVCADLLGGSGTADRRDLEGLFSKQRAYFIKDLIRKRVFAERGLVRPTQRRVARARRNAVLGYGAAGLIAVAAVLGSVFYLASGRDRAEYETYDRALASARAATSESLDVPRLLGTLDDVLMAIDVERAGLEEMFQSSRAGFTELYCAFFDETLLPELRAMAEDGLVVRLASDPVSHADFRQKLAQVEFLMQRVELRDPDQVERLTAFVPQSMRTAVLPAMAANRRPLTLERAIERRRDQEAFGVPTSDPRRRDGGLSAGLAEAAARATELWDGVLSPGRPWQAEGELGYLLAWKGLVDSDAAFTALRPDEPASVRRVYELAAQWSGSEEKLSRFAQGLPEAEEGRRLLRRDLCALQLEQLEAERAAFLERSGQDAAAEWIPARAIRAFADHRFPQAETPGGALMAQLEVPHDEILALRDRALSAACQESFLPRLTWKPDELADDVRSGREAFISGDVFGKAGTVFLAKLVYLADEYRERYPEWLVLARDLRADDAEAFFRPDLVGHLDGLRRELAAVGPELLAGWIEHLDALLLQYLEEVERRWASSEEERAEGGFPAVDWSIVLTLREAQGSAAGDSARVPGRVQIAARDLWIRHLTDAEERMLAYCERLDEDGASTLEILRNLQDQLANLDRSPGARRDLADVDLHHEWLEEMDDLLADRLDEHRAELEDHWGAPPPSAMPTLHTAARSIIDKTEIKALRDRIDEVATLAAPDPEDPALDPELAIYEDLPRTARALQALKELSSPTTARKLSNQDYTEWLRSFVLQFEDSALAEDGPLMAKIFFESARPDAQRPEPPRGAGGCFVQGLFDSFQERLLTEIRRRYLEDVQELVTGDYAGVVDALFADPDVWDELPDDRDLMKPLLAFFRERGELDALRSRYEDEGIPLRYASGTEPSIEREWWQLERFLCELQAFLVGDGKKNLEQVVLTLEVQPDTSDPHSIWFSRAEGGKSCFWVSTASVGSWRFDFTSDDMDPIAVEWGFRPDPDRLLRLRWSDDVVESETVVEGDAWLRCPTSLGPLLLAWSGHHDDGRYHVMTRVQGSKLLAPFTLRFVERDLPPRPTDPR